MMEMKKETQPGTNPFTDYGNDDGDNPSATGGCWWQWCWWCWQINLNQPVIKSGGNGQPFLCCISFSRHCHQSTSICPIPVGPTGLYGGGGGGGQATPNNAGAGEGGPGGGADGGPGAGDAPSSHNGVSHTGGGAGGGGTQGSVRGWAGGTGGPGIVIVRYSA